MIFDISPTCQVLFGCEFSLQGRTVKQFRVLIVDDEIRIVKFLELKLKASGYEVLTASNGLEALAQVQTQEPDLVVLDVIMPGMDGFETLKQIRALSSVPVIILCLLCRLAQKTEVAG